MLLEVRDRNTGSLVPANVSRGALLTNASGGKYAEAALAGRLFSTANVNVLATSTTLNVTFTGLGLYNPIGSGKLIVMHEFGYAWDTAGAATGIVLALAVTDTTNTTAMHADLTIECARPNYDTSVCFATEAATIAAPTIVKIVSQHATAATTTFVSLPRVIDLAGCIILPPGQTLVTDTTLADTAQFSFLWEEIDL